MSDPSKPKIGWKTIWRLNLRFVGGGLALLYGWVCWQFASKEMWGFWLIGGLGLLGGGMQVIGAFFEAGAMIINQISWRVFRRQGVKPRADRLANEADVLNGGRKS